MERGGLTDEGLKVLSGLKACGRWHRRTRVGDAGMAHLEAAAGVLDLEGTAVTGKALPHLGKLTGW